MLDCRSDNQYRESTIKGALGASFAKKPFGSGPQSMAKLSGFIEDVRNRMQKHHGILIFDEGQGMYASRLGWLLHSAGIKDLIRNIVRNLKVKTRQHSAEQGREAPHFFGPLYPQILFLDFI